MKVVLDKTEWENISNSISPRELAIAFTIALLSDDMGCLSMKLDDLVALTGSCKSTLANSLKVLLAKDFFATVKTGRGRGAKVDAVIADKFYLVNAVVANEKALEFMAHGNEPELVKFMADPDSAEA